METSFCDAGGARKHRVGDGVRLNAHLSSIGASIAASGHATAPKQCRSRIAQYPGLATNLAACTDAAEPAFLTPAEAFRLMRWAVALVLFGANKIPTFMKGLGQGIKEFKKASGDVQNELERAMHEEPPRRPAPAPAAPAPTAAPAPAAPAPKA